MQVFSTSGPPGAVISTAVIISGNADTNYPLTCSLGAALLRSLSIDSKRTHVKTLHMDMDDLPLRRDDPLAQLTRQDLDPLSVDELNERIQVLKNEITRCEGKIAFATRHRSAADELFKKT